MQFTKKVERYFLSSHTFYVLDESNDASEKFYLAPVSKFNNLNKNGEKHQSVTKVRWLKIILNKTTMNTTAS